MPDDPVQPSGPWDKYKPAATARGEQTPPGPWQKYGGLVTPPGQQVAGKPKADLPADLPQRSVDLGLSALPYAAAAGAGLFTGEMGWIPATAYAMGAGGFGGLVEETGREITGLKPAKTPGEFGKRVGADVLEQGAYEVSGRATGAILARTVGKYFNPERLYQSGLKPPAGAPRAVEAGLREGIPLSAETARPAVRQKINALNSQIEQAIQGTPSNIPANQWTAAVQRKLDALRVRWGKVAGQGPDLVRQIDNFEKDFLLQSGNPTPGYVGGQVVNPADMDLPMLRQHVGDLTDRSAQDIKKATYEAIRTRSSQAYLPGVHPALQTRMQQDVASALRQEIENLHPEIKTLNAREGALMDLDKALRSYVRREGNKQMTPYFIFPTVGGLAGFATAGVEGAERGGLMALGFDMMRRVVEDPEVKSKIAIALAKAAKRPALKTVGKIASRTITPQNIGRAARFEIEDIQR